MSFNEPVIDFSTLEKEKENITATRTGHSALALQQTFSVPRNQRGQQLAEVKVAFEDEIARAQRESADPLDAYVKFVDWTLDSYPGGKSADSGLVPLLERATRAFKEDVTYQHDLRYLNLWLQFANLVAKPEMIYAFLIANDIGTRYSLLYSEYAVHLERQGHRERADEVYRLGMARNAKPPNLLLSQFEAFQARMLTAPRGGVHPISPDARATPAPAGGSRRVLGESGASNPIPSTTPASATGRAGASSSNKGRIAVFSDAAAGPSNYSANEWKTLGSQAAIDKENTQEATPFGGSTLPQRITQSPKTPKFSVLKDTDPGETPKPLGGKTPDVRLPSERPMTESELLFLDPFKNYAGDLPVRSNSDNPSQLSTSAKLVSARASSLPQGAAIKTRPLSLNDPDNPSNWPKPKPFVLPEDEPPIPGQAPRKPEQYMFTFSLLYDPKEDREYSIYEARARSQGLLGKNWPSPPLDLQEHDTYEPLKTSSIRGRTSRRSVLGRKSLAREPTVTINTKAAMEDVLGMYNGEDIEEGDEESFDESPQATIPPTPTPSSRLPTSSSTNTLPMDTKAKSKSTPKITPFVDPPPSVAPIIVQEKIRPFVDPQGDMTARPPFFQASRASSSGKPRAPPPFKPFVDEISPTPLPATERAPAEQSSMLTEDKVAIDVGNLTTQDELSNLFSKSLRVGNPMIENDTGVNSSSGSAKHKLPLAVDDIFSASTAHMSDASEEESKSTADRPGWLDMHFVSKSKGPSSLSGQDSEGSLGGPAQVSFATGARLDTSTRRSPSHLSEEDVHYEEEDDWSSDDRQDEFRADIPESEDYEEEDHGRHPRRMNQYINELTPIIERTYEFTRTSIDPNTASTRPSRGSGGGTLEGPMPSMSRTSSSRSMEPVHEEYELKHDDRPRKSFAPRQSVARGRQSLAAGQETPQIPNPCNPFDDLIMRAILDITGSPWYDLRDRRCGQFDILQKKFKGKKYSVDGRRSSAAVDLFRLTLDGDHFDVSAKLGEGAFGAVYLANLVDDTEGETSAWAIKAAKPAQVWEYTAILNVRDQLPSDLQPCIIEPIAHYAFQDESYLLMAHSPYGTLLDCVNKAAGTELAQSAGDGLTELMVVFFTVELLRIVEGLHSHGWIHGDLKIDNCLVRLADIPGPSTAWSSRYDPSGADGWGQQGLTLIDFGRAIDSKLFEAGQTFVGDWPVDHKDCVEMREGQPWTFETDYYGLAGIIHCMLYKKNIETESVLEPLLDESRRHKIKAPLKRYWANDWNHLFGVLLNPRFVHTDKSLPIHDELAEIRTKMEGWLVENSWKGGKSLKTMLKKIRQLAL